MGGAEEGGCGLCYSPSPVSPPADGQNGRDGDTRPFGASSPRLESWKEIAAHLKRGVTTVQRWEKQEGLPVHRLHHEKLGSVYALPSEVDAWWESRRRLLEARDSPEPNDVSAGASDPADSSGGGRAIRRTGGAFRNPRLSRVVPLVVVGACGAAVWAAVPHLFGRPAEPPALVRFQIGPPEGAAFAGNSDDPAPAVSPDGQTLVFRAAFTATGRQVLFLRRLDSTVAQALAGTDNAILPFWSPDGKRIGFFADGFLRTLTLATGRVETLAAAPEAEGGVWRGSDIVFAPGRGSALQFVPETGGPSEPFTRLDASSGELRHSFPAVLPSGEVLFHINHSNPARQGVAGTRAALRAQQLIMTGPAMAAPVPSGYLLWFHEGRFRAQAFDARTMSVQGEPLGLAERIDEGPEVWRSPRVSASDSVLVFWDPKGGPLTRLTWFDRQGRELGTVGPTGHYASIALSPDQAHVAVQRTFQAGGSPDLWLFGVEDGKAVRLTSSPANDEDPVWRTDSAVLAFAKHRGLGEPSDLRRLALARPLDDLPLWRADLSAHPTDWSRDAKWVVFQMQGRGNRSDIWMVPAGGGEARPLVRSDHDEAHGRLSPDGSHLAYSSDQSGQREVYVRSLGPDGSVHQASNAGGAHPRWRADGSELFYLSATGHIVAVPVTPGVRPRLGTPVQLFHARPVLPLVFSDVTYDVSRDGSRFLVAAGPPVESRPMTVVLNWQSQLRR